MSTTSLTAGEVMDRSAALMNDPDKTDYTYMAQLPYLNMAIDELVESLEESNSSPTNMTSPPIIIPVGTSKITPPEHIDTPHYPADLIEVQGIGERGLGSLDPFIPLGRRDFLQAFPTSQSLIFWFWEDQTIKFNPNGALGPREIQIQYVRQPFTLAASEFSVIGVINARSYLSYKTAALCAFYIGENPTRAEGLNDQAEQALERLSGINNKGRQFTMTRHRPFRAAYKARGGF